MEAAGLNCNMTIPEKAVRESFSRTVEKGRWISLMQWAPGPRKEVQISYLMAGRRIALPIMKCTFSRLDIGLCEIEMSSWKASSPLRS